MIYEEPIAPTLEAIEAWRAQEKTNKPADAVFAKDYDQYGVNVWTKSGSCRCIVGGVGLGPGELPGYWTIRGEGSSNGGRDTWVLVHKIVRAVGWIVGERDPRVIALKEKRAA